MNFHRRELLKIASATGGAAFLPATAFSQTTGYPQGPVRVIVPFTAGSTTDVIGRIVGERLDKYLGQPFVIENRPGAGGTLGAAQVASAAPDGQTLLIHSAGHVANAALYPALKYDTLKDFTPVTMLASMPNVFVVAPSKGFTSLKELVGRVSAEPGKYMYGSSGNGSASHIAGEKFRIAAAIHALHVPYRGTPEALNDVMGGRVDWFLLPLAVAAPLVKTGRLVALSIGAAARSAVLPDVPTTAECGLHDADHTFWVGMFAPARTPATVLARLHAETVRALDSDEARPRLEKLGAQPAPMPQQQFATLVRDETAATAALIKQAGIRLES
ncbi:tripartite tricarboxylate transporter substrate binding protein [Pantoea sp. 18069]|uniref:Bug family tripartite tricarboxylate transporter substrate binding protein n=1 Tax=Pantoea sp. 18069 TaxID=2681415 RepID=UPI00135C7C6F|nr:tripartite tricarboxylate transporter substrate binding protein [Pantoea sp. 18069]